MVILIVGARGFIGAALTGALRRAGNAVLVGTRRAAGPDQVALDFSGTMSIEQWTSKLAGVDVLVNAAGILRERGVQTFVRIHDEGPRRLFEACVAAGVKRVVQISALGAERRSSRYFASKAAADEFLAGLPLEWTIVRPSVVYGRGGTSARLFNVLASLPIILLPGSGRQRLQIVHVDDVVAALVTIICDGRCFRQYVPLVGPEPLELRHFLQRLRDAMHAGGARFLPIPMMIMRIAASLGQFLPRSLLDRETLAMLEMQSVASPETTEQLLGRAPRSVDTFIDPINVRSVLIEARLAWLLPLLRWSIALVWIWTGIVSFGLYPRDHSYELLAAVGVHGGWAPLLLYGAATIDLMLGFATIFLPRRRVLWLLQLALIAGYTAIISWALPHFWLHPYGPLIKNLPMLAGICALYFLEPER